MNSQSIRGFYTSMHSSALELSKNRGSDVKSVPTLFDQDSTASKSSAKVFISDKAKTLAEKESTSTQTRTAIQERLLKIAASNPVEADVMVRGFVDTPSTIFYDISDQLKSGQASDFNVLSSSGRIINQEFKDKFAREAAVIDAERKAIYSSEKAKGTPPAEILGKLFDYINKQSSDYLEATGWMNGSDIRVNRHLSSS